MAKGLGISTILNQESRAKAAGTHTVNYINIDNIHEHTDNRKYSPERIELLAREIELDGLQSPIIIAETGTGKYVAVSGHRRLAAFRLLASEGKTQFQTIPAIVRTSLDEKAIRRQLISGNLYTEPPTDAEIAEQLAWMKKDLQERKENGEKISGRLLELLAADLGITPETARRMDRINRTAIPEVREEFAGGGITTREAFLIAKLPQEQQKEALEKKQSGEVKHLFPAKRSPVEGVHVPPESPKGDPDRGVHVPPEEEGKATSEPAPIDASANSPLKKAVQEMADSCIRALTDAKAENDTEAIAQLLVLQTGIVKLNFYIESKKEKK